MLDESPLRIAVVCQGEIPNAWELESLEQTLRVPGVAIVALIVVDQKSAKLSFLMRRLLARGSALKASTRPERFRATSVFRAGQSDAGQTLSDAEERRLRHLHPDLILSFLPVDFAPSLADLPRHGLWRFRFGHRYSGAASAVAARNFVRRETLQYACLERWNPRDPRHTQVLKDGILKCGKHSLSAYLDQLFFQCTPWAASLCRALKSETPVERLTKTVPLSLTPTVPPNGLWATALAALMGARVARRSFGLARRLFLYQQWNVGIIRKSIQELVNAESPPKIDWLPRPTWPHFIADPFPVTVDGVSRIFVESYDFTTGEGHIVSLPFENGRADGEASSAIELPFHMSYPCLVKDQGELYCIPETLRAGELALYKCLHFPNRWIKHRVILRDRLFVDPTLFYHERRWWLFCTLFDSHSEGNTHLHAWHAESLHGEWTAHAANPLKSDVRSSRSAGTPFYLRKQLYRPAQDCSWKYGGSTVMNRISKLTPDEFSEETVSRILPDKAYPTGCHHLAAFGAYTLIDGRDERLSLRAAWCRLQRIDWSRWPWRKRAAPLSAPKPALRSRLVEEPLGVLANPDDAVVSLENSGEFRV